MTVSTFSHEIQCPKAVSQTVALAAVVVSTDRPKAAAAFGTPDLFSAKKRAWCANKELTSYREPFDSFLMVTTIWNGLPYHSDLIYRLDSVVICANNDWTSGDFGCIFEQIWDKTNWSNTMILTEKTRCWLSGWEIRLAGIKEIFRVFIKMTTWRLLWKQLDLHFACTESSGFCKTFENF